MREQENFQSSIHRSPAEAADRSWTVPRTAWGSVEERGGGVGVHPWGKPRRGSGKPGLQAGGGLAKLLFAAKAGQIASMRHAAGRSSRQVRHILGADILQTELSLHAIALRTSYRAAYV